MAAWTSVRSVHSRCDLQDTFLRLKLWLCTGLIALDEGEYKDFGFGVGDPTKTIPLGLNTNIGTTRTSARTFNLSQETIIAAQWMLLYCKNIQRREPPGTPYLVSLTATYAPENVKCANSTLALLSTSFSDIDRAEKREIELCYVSDSDEHDDEEERSDSVPQIDKSTSELLEPMFPEPGSEEYGVFE